MIRLLLGAALGGVQGAFLAVPTVAAGEVIMERLQLRAVPIAQDSTAELDNDGDEVEQRLEPITRPVEPAVAAR